MDAARDQTCTFCDSGTESGFFFIFIHLFGCVRSYLHPAGSFIVAPELASCMGLVASGLFTSEPSGNPPTHTPRIKTPVTVSGKGLEPQRRLKGRVSFRRGGGTWAPAAALCVGPVEGCPGDARAGGRQLWPQAPRCEQSAKGSLSSPSAETGPVDPADPAGAGSLGKQLLA